MKMLMSARFARKSFLFAAIGFVLFIQCVIILPTMPELIPVAFPGLIISAAITFLGILGIMPRFCKKSALVGEWLRRYETGRKARTAALVQRITARKAREEDFRNATLGTLIAKLRTAVFFASVRLRRLKWAKNAQLTLPL
ncbi:MAG: hypothetical protein WC227_02925 [Patescibacteria group bacterium]|jgi:hypothetical protein